MTRAVGGLTVQRDGSPYGWGDAAAVALLLGGTVLYLALLPRNLGPADESVHLYDAKRLLGGAVMYRDVFNDITPGWMYLMALLFGLFGTTITVARIAMAVIHGLSTSVVYATCRALNVPRVLSWPPALAYLVVCQSAWPIASQHWLSTFLSVVTLWLCALHLRDRGRWSLALGIVLGLFVGVQQQRAAMMVAGVVVWLALDFALERRYGARRSIRSLIATLAWAAAGGALVVVPLLSWLVARAGFARVWRALVIFPLYDYAGVTHCPWGDVNIMTAWQGSFTFPLFLKYLPAAMIPAAARLAWALARGRSREEAARLLLLLVTAATSIVSISYFPDFIHIAFIAPVFLVMLAESADWAVRSAVRPAVPAGSGSIEPHGGRHSRPYALRTAGVLAGAALIAACGLRLHHNRLRLYRDFPASRSSAFGRVDMKEQDALLYDRVRELMSGTSSPYLYCYPIISHLYLMLDAENPTAHGFFSPGYSGPDLVQEVVDSLAATRPPYIVFLTMFRRPDDRVADWIEEHYEPIEEQVPQDKMIYRPKPA